MRRSTAERENKIRKNQLYILCMVGMTLLVVLAMFLPQMIFSMQDAYQMNHTQVQVRSNPDITQLNLTYERDLNTRIRNYLNLKNRTATAIDYEASENSEVQDLALSVFYEQWFEPLWYEQSFIIDYINKMHYEITLDTVISDCKKYLIHGADYQDGVALVMWYLDLDLSPLDMRIRLLVDAETSTIYYMRVTSSDNEEEANIAYSDKNNREEILYYLLEVIRSYYEFYYSYYEADEVGFITEGYDVPKYYTNAMSVTATEDEEIWHINSKIQENQCEMSFYLPYENYGIDFLFRAEYKNGSSVDVTMGLPIIGEMIPEMMQD